MCHCREVKYIEKIIVDGVKRKKTNLKHHERVGEKDTNMRDTKSDKER